MQQATLMKAESFDIPEPTYDEETKIISGGDEIYEPDPRGLGYCFYTSMKKNRKLTGQLDTETGMKESFGNILNRSIRTAIEMKTRGIQPGDIISICSGNTINNFIPFISAQMVGAIVASLDPTISLVDTKHLIKQVNPKMIFVASASEHLIQDALDATGLATEIVTFGDNNKYSKFSDFITYKENENEFKPYEVDDLKQTAAILFSSGTTGLSKGICINHYGLLYQGFSFISTGCVFNLMLSYASTYWISTLILMVNNLVYGKCRCIVSKFNPKDIWYIISKYKVTFLFAAPSQAIQMLKVGRPEGVNTTSLRDVIIAGGPMSESNNMAFRDILPGTLVYLAYGQSEAAGIVTQFRSCNRKDVLYLHDKPSSSGRPLLGLKYMIIDPESEKPLGLNKRGELRYFGNCQMNGYYNLDASNAFDDNGWIKTGDIAYFDDDLCIYIVDRIKEMLKFQAFHIPPAKIEGVLLTHPAVAIAVVIGIPNEDDGDHPMGLVILQPDGTATPEELVEYVEKRVDDRHRLRAGVKIVTTVPYTPTGKIKKHVLRSMVLAGEI